MKQGQAVMKTMPDKENLIIEITDSIRRLTTGKEKLKNNVSVSFCSVTNHCQT